MLSTTDHLDNLIRHIELVREATTLLGKRLISQGRVDFGRLLIARGFKHDVSKFAGIEWDFLHAGKDTPKEQLELAVNQHVRTNSHHPEFHGGFQNMPELDVAECVCDWYARSQEFGTSVRTWIKEVGVQKFNIDINSQEYKWVNSFLDILLEDSFVR